MMVVDRLLKSIPDGIVNLVQIWAIRWVSGSAKMTWHFDTTKSDVTPHDTSQRLKTMVSRLLN